MSGIERTDRQGETSEIEVLAEQLALAYRRMFNSFRKDFELEPVEADRRARGLDVDPKGTRERIAGRPASELSWWELADVIEHDPTFAMEQWARIKRTAMDELTSGHRTAEALEWKGTPWERARFLALREAFAESWEPRGRFEAALIDMCATEFSNYLKWTEHAIMYSEVEATREKSQAEKDGYWVPPKMSIGEAIDWANAQVEKAHRRFLLSLRALHEMRRLPPVYVNAADRVTVGGQHVHVSGTKRDNSVIEE